MSKRVRLIHDGLASSNYPSLSSDEVTNTSSARSANEIAVESKFPTHPFSAAANDEKGGQKRARDASGIDKFKQIIYGEKGFTCLHAMVERNPILMFPPRSVFTTRLEWLRQQQSIDAAMQKQLKLSTASNVGSEESLRPISSLEEVDILDLIEKRRRLETATASSSSCSFSTTKLEVATYHHKQLDSFLKLVYEFNHATLLKMPMHDTLRMLSRCGRESVAHLTEFEMRARLQREKKLDEMRKIRKRRVELEGERLEKEVAQEALELELAEEQLKDAMQHLDDLTSLSN